MSHRRWATASLWAFWAALGALMLRFWWAGPAAYTFNEATYVDLAAHPWWSSYYPDTVFVRHPPLAFLVMAAWRAVAGDAEAVMRFPSLLASLAGVGLTWSAATRLGGDRAGAATALLLSLSIPLHAYAVQATLYPYAFLAAAGVAWAWAHGRVRLLAWLFTVFALTHLFGFLFLGLWAWKRRTAWRSALRTASPALAWLALSFLAALWFNTEGDVMRLGAFGQAVRGAATTEDAVAVHPLTHLSIGLLCVGSLGPLLLAALWQGHRRASWTLGVLFLAAYAFVSAPYPRYALVPLPLALLATAWVPRRALGATVLVALLVLPAGAWYLEHGPDPRAAGDVPGLQEWDDAVAMLPPGPRVATSGPTATAYYLGPVTDRSEAPYRIGLEDRTIIRLDAPADVDLDADVWLVPDHWKGVEGLIAARGGGRCGHVTGIDVYATGCQGQLLMT